MAGYVGQQLTGAPEKERPGLGSEGFFELFFGKVTLSTVGVLVLGSQVRKGCTKPQFVQDWWTKLKAEGAQLFCGLPHQLSGLVEHRRGVLQMACLPDLQSYHRQVLGRAVVKALCNAMPLVLFGAGQARGQFP